jgi:hypothetical protein
MTGKRNHRFKSLISQVEPESHRSKNCRSKASMRSCSGSDLQRLRRLRTPARGFSADGYRAD